MPQPFKKLPDLLVKSHRDAQIGLHLADLDRATPTMRMRVAAMASGDGVFRVDDEPVVRIVGDLLDCALVVDLVRENNRRLNERPCRAYLREPGCEWRKLRDDDVLTVKDGGPSRLNPLIFPPLVRAAPLIAPKRLEW